MTYMAPVPSLICDDCRMAYRIEGDDDILDRVCRLIDREVNLKFPHPG